MSVKNILCLGDIIGVTGRYAIRRHLEEIKLENNIDFIIANGENAANGIGITRDTAAELFNSGIDVLTSGNHIWNNRDVFALIGNEHRLLRPYNYPSDAPGLGYYIYDMLDCKIGVINLMGRTFMDTLDCPFKKANLAIKHIKEKTNIIFIDFHAEATAEKIAFSYYLESQVSCIFGTHTHVQTADEKILSSYTAYISDVGMCGSYNSVIGMKKEPAIARFVTKMPHRFEVETTSPMINGIVVQIDTVTGKAISIKRINLVYHNDIVERQEK
ncbi:TIGR00282 family metallophosphoesterase [Brachyspira hyodysenteriae]|uniref:Metallophosphoesterase n=1 Tax=Brachyspira hyodysenteriae ATCC 27164 TaxID=1266923 RepID=A0A3B6VTT1_BRAHO|nr:TIGR00282 family metallophosphoesterase [Brachyspira hyodysenteriae]ANN64306.1 metallophosphoesterase [Brachyspira hyodysenteriae ATCC 27164]AUJ49300.1 metallophosphoesterase [Brachyspira hyodysenteriae]KLI18094.1 metallophosphoesterase [Brachyspira hyodysenteriae]KLI18530.1 metallophosphoesterase [Brachyspira hyodysenteriae]KLI20019.1 metallophosphoesterase [Brachyspira hyodysenteriae]